jgi:peptidoglycan/LPS O-acetylase OafA/YrhL
MVASAHSWQSPWRDASGQLRNFYVPAVDVDGPVLAAITPYFRIFNNGGGAVAAFFVISGFVLALSLERGPNDLPTSGSRFFLSRVFRIYPAIIATVVIFALAYWMTEDRRSGAGYSAVDIVQNMLLLSTSMNGVMWSLQVELVAAFVIFLAFVLHRRWGNGAVLSLTVLLVALSFLGSKMRVLGADLTALYAFPFGMLAFYYRHLVRRFPVKWSVASFSLIFVAMCSLRQLTSYTSHWAAIGEVVLAALVVAYLADGVLGPVGLLFDHPMIRFYGRISYSLYLLHPPTFFVIWSVPDAIGTLVRWGIPTAIVAFGLSALTIVAITPLAWLIYRYVERPGVHVGRFVFNSAVTRAGKNRISV